MTETWATRWTFILAASGSAIGLGNIWKFPFITGENGGGAFVLVYLLCIAMVGIPIMMSEVLIGRHARHNPITAMGQLARESGASRLWGGVGWMGVLAGIMILSFYSVVAGWSLDYTVELFAGNFNGMSSDEVGVAFGEGLLQDVTKLTIWHTVFMVLTAIVVALGIHKGLENSVKLMMPALFVLLLAMLVYSATQTGHFGQGFNYLFDFDFSKLSWNAVLSAMGHAFFTLSLGMCAIMAYGAYMPKQASIGGTVITVAVLDTLVALIAGLVIFPIVFANGMEPSAGPGLLFVSLTSAFAQLPGGQFVGGVFFLLVSIAALSSSISLIEPSAAWVTERFNMGRVGAVTLLSLIVWVFGIACLLSLNVWSGAEYQLFGMGVFDLFDFLTANIMLPLGGMLIAIFAGWVMKRSVVLNELALKSLVRFNLWRSMVRVISPLAVFVVFVMTLYQKFSGA
ncbi:sodium-dependent transporter [Aestuariirhabdus litorea]|uniref:sodium-dependent transporter n=1 Tax=Aestuariirhabdus litorea TaxID=2528527 RepID=UPI001FB2F909|nr:sodium-dependent transporter [Aestuariirhabdus litorea]